MGMTQGTMGVVVHGSRANRGEGEKQCCCFLMSAKVGRRARANACARGALLMLLRVQLSSLTTACLVRGMRASVVWQAEGQRAKEERRGERSVGKGRREKR